MSPSRVPNGSLPVPPVVLRRRVRHDFAGMSRQSPRSFLFAMFHGGGNLALIMPVVRALGTRGHRIRVIAGPRIWVPQPPPPTPLLDLIERAGATAVRLAQPSTSPHAAGHRLPGLLLGWNPRRLRKARNLGIASWWAPVWAQATAAEIARSRPDAVVADYFLLGAIAAAEQARVPIGVLVHNVTYPGPLPGMPPPNTGFGPERNLLAQFRDVAWGHALRFAAARNALPCLNEARAGVGLPPLRSPFDQYQVAGRVLILTSRAFDFSAASVPANVRYVGTPFDEMPSALWASPWPVDDSRPLVLVSLSTLNQGQGPVMQRILEAVAPLDARVLVTLGPSLSASDFAAPPNARLERFVPHEAVLPAAAVLVTQCGLSTVSKALSHGVPMVCIPLTADQPDNAARVVAAGAGLRLSMDADAAKIAQAIRQVLSDGRYRQSAQRMADRVGAEAGANAAAQELEELAGAGQRPTDRPG